MSGKCTSMNEALRMAGATEACATTTPSALTGTVSAYCPGCSALYFTASHCSKCTTTLTSRNSSSSCLVYSFVLHMRSNTKSKVFNRYITVLTGLPLNFDRFIRIMLRIMGSPPGICAKAIMDSTKSFWSLGTMFLWEVVGVPSWFRIGDCF